jgi:gamma-glutamylcyclotransferase (GGCT)/AIG2-like uncharacterized protein YtfP
MGTDRVQGECWRFHEHLLPEVLESLDEIEGTHQRSGDADEYHRIIVDVFLDDGSRRERAYVYVYATDPRQDGFHPINPIRPGGEVTWP